MIMIIFLLLCIFIHVLCGFIVSMLLGLLRSIYLHSIKCPNCKKPIDNWTTIFSGNNDGLFKSISKKCKNCGYDFMQK